MMIEAPNYTQVPNVLLDKLASEMNEAEFRVTMAICRKVLGWHKEKDRISISQLMALTGLSNKGVINGIKDGIERGTIIRYLSGQDYYYSVKFDNEYENKIIIKIYESKKTIPKNLRWEVLERDNFTCLNCGSRKRLTIDHILAESMGGKMEISNLQTLCKTCNSQKGTK
jgi:phage replication O-like protein O